MIREYRGRVFNTISAAVRPAADGTVRYGVALAIPKIASSEIHGLAGTWADTSASRSRGEWQRAPMPPVGVSEPVLSGQTEIFTLPGPEFFPSAIVLLDHRAMTARVLIAAAAYSRAYPTGPSLDALLAVSRKKDVDRVAAMERIQRERVARYRAEGLGEGDAILKAYRDLENLGYLPKSPRMIAYRVDPGDAASSSLPLFEIAEPEMASGIFPDLERALSSPGTEVEKSMGRYIVHRDYTTSARLSDSLEHGDREFLVRFRGATYRVEIR